MRSLLLLFALFSWNLLAEEPATCTTLLKTTLLLEGAIDPISGSWHDSEIDLSVEGSSLYLQRFHSSLEPGFSSIRSENWRQKKGFPLTPPINQWNRWSWNQSTLLLHYHREHIAYLQEFQGQSLGFSVDKKNRASLRYSHWNNLHAIQAGARADPHNYKLELCLEGGEEKKGEYKLLTPEGMVRSFGNPCFLSKAGKNDVWIGAEKERLYPNGAHWRYSYAPNKGDSLCMQIEKVEELDREGSPIQELRFEEEGKKVSSSSGNWVLYETIDSSSFCDLLRSVKRSNGPSCTYEYLFPSMTWTQLYTLPSFLGEETFSPFFSPFPKTAVIPETFTYFLPPQIGRKTYEEGRYRRMEYNPFESSLSLPYFVYPKFAGAIRGYFGPVGEGGREEAIYTIEYEKNRRRLYHGKKGEGKVEEYFLGPEDRLEHFVESGPDKKPKRIHFFDYNKNGYLVRECLSDGQTVESLSFFRYDEKGNVVQKTLFGSICKKAPEKRVDTKGAPLSPLDSNGCPPFLDSYTIESLYSDRPSQLKIAEIYPGGRSEWYTYESESDAISSKLVRQGKKIVEREFFFYDKHGVVVLEIQDDGSSPYADSYEGVFHQKKIERSVGHEGAQKGLVLSQSLLSWQPGQKETLWNRVTYSYNAQRLPILENHFDAITGSSFEVSYTYDDRGNPIQEKDARGALTQRLWAKDNRLLWEKGPDPRVEKFYSYDADRRLSCSIEKHEEYPGKEWITRYQYDLLGRVVRLEAPYGLYTDFTYDWAGRVVLEKKGGILNKTSESCTEFSQEYGYDRADRKIYQREEGQSAGEQRFNLFGKPLFQRSAQGATQEFFYDTYARLQKIVHNEKWSEWFFYNERGLLCSIEREGEGKRELVCEISYLGNRKAEQRDFLGNCDRWRYDGLGRVVEKERIDGKSHLSSREEWSYDGWGSVLRHRKWQDSEEFLDHLTSYNGAGDLLCESLENSKGELFDQISYKRDESGRILSSSTFFGSKQWERTFAYDSLGNKILEKDEEGALTQWQHTYFLKPNISGIAGLAIHTLQRRKDRSLQESYLDARGWQICQKIWQEPKGQEEKGELLQEQWVGYNAQGDLVFRKEKSLPEDREKAIWIETKIEYGAGKQILKRWDNHGSVLERLRTWEYDSHGLCIKKTEPSGLFHTYLYDCFGALESTESSDGSIDYSYQRDRLSRPIVVRNNLTGKSTLRTYDAWSHIIEEQTEEGERFERSWNALDQPTVDLYPSGVQVLRSYQGGLLRKTSARGLEQTIEQYDEGARTILEQQPLQRGKLVSSFDSKGRLTSFESGPYKASDIFYDPVDNLVSRVITNRVYRVKQDSLFQIFGRWSHSSLLQKYAYDRLGQLTYESAPLPIYYENDSRYCRLRRKQKGCEERFSLDALDQIFEIQKFEIQKNESKDFQETYEKEIYEYDFDGHLTARIVGEKRWEYSYDAWSRLLSLKGPEGSSFYSYDGFNRRIKARHESDKGVEKKIFGYLGQMLARIRQSLDSANELLEERYFVRATGSERGDTLAWFSNEKGYLPIHDMSGSCIGWQDLQGELLALWSYDSFGNLVGQSLGPWGFSGKYSDPFTGMVAFGLRDYLPSIGRWLTKDPQGEIDASNLYCFLGNNPVTRCDEWGTSAFYTTPASFSTSLYDLYFERYRRELFDCSSKEGLLPAIRNGNLDLRTKNFCHKEHCAFLYRYLGENPSFCNPVIKINGNCTSFKETLEDAKRTAEALRGDVYYCYNASSIEEYPYCVAMVYDGARALSQRTLAPFYTGAERYFYQILMGLKEQKEILGIFHSYGMQIATNAQRKYGLKSSPYYDPEFEKILLKTNVRALAGSGPIDAPWGFASFVNTVCTNDLFIRCLDGGAIDKQRELNILKEVAPVIDPKARGWNRWKQKHLPDHFLYGPTCKNAQDDAITKWQRK